MGRKAFGTLSWTKSITGPGGMEKRASNAALNLPDNWFGAHNLRFFDPLPFLSAFKTDFVV